MIAADRPACTRFWTLPRCRRHAGYAIAAAMIGGLASLSGWSGDHALLINATDSLPSWAFWIDRHGRPARGDYIFFDPPPSALLTRHFGEKLQPFGKIVYGVGGDRVTTRGRLFLVNGRAVALAKRATLRGERLAIGPVGIIPPGCYFVATPHRDSFDSRYAAIGWICRPRVLGTGRAIL